MTWLPRTLWSLRLDVGRPDHFGPLVGLISNEFSEFDSCQRHRLIAQACKARPHIVLVDDGIDLLLELFDNSGGSALRRTEAIPCAGLIARHVFTHGRNVRQNLRARRTGYGKGSHLAGFDVFL